MTQVEATLAIALAYGRQGGATVYTIAFSFAQLPVGVLAISVMTVLVPALAGRASAGDLPGYRAQLERATSLTLALVIPAAVAYVILAPSIVSILIERGRVSAGDAAYVGRLVQIFTVSLPAYSLWLLVLRGSTHCRTPGPRRGSTSSRSGLSACSIWRCIHSCGSRAWPGPTAWATSLVPRSPASP